MDMGRFEGGHFELNISDFTLDKLAACIDCEIASLCADKGLAWKLHMDNVLVSTDEELLLRLMRNLLSNAVRYTDAGVVSCSAKVADDVAEFEITDTGCGIATEHQEAVFNEFVRLTNDGVRSSGVGLGLSIVKKINLALDLGLQMSSSPGQGTRFTFRLPVVTEADRQLTLSIAAAGI
jgi:signal transduction histidine kinase